MVSRQRQRRVKASSRDDKDKFVAAEEDVHRLDTVGLLMINRQSEMY